MMRSATPLPPSFVATALDTSASGIVAVSALEASAIERSKPATFWKRLRTRSTNSGRSQNVSVRMTRSRVAGGCCVSWGGSSMVIAGRAQERRSGGDEWPRRGVEGLLGQRFGWQPPREPQREQGRQGDAAEREPERLQLRVTVIGGDGVGLLSRRATVDRGLLDDVDGHDVDALLRLRRDCLARLRRDGGVVEDAVAEAGGERGEQDGADDRGAERGAEVLGCALKPARLAGLLRRRGRHDHVAELGGEQAGAGAGERQRELESGDVERDVERREHDRGA